MRYSRLSISIAVLVFAAGTTGSLRGADLTDENCTKFGKQLEARVNAGDTAGIRQAIDWGRSSNALARGSTRLMLKKPASKVSGPKC